MTIQMKTSKINIGYIFFYIKIFFIPEGFIKKNPT